MSKQVVVFTQPGCRPCDTLKAYLTEKGVEFQDRDVTADPNAVNELIFKYKSRQTPTTVIGEEVIIGFDRHRIEEILSK